MNALRLEVASWPPDPRLRERRWPIRLLAGLTDELAALGRGHALLTHLLDHFEQATCDDLADIIGEIDRTIITPIGTAALLELARPLHDVHRLLDHGFQQRTQAIIRLRRLTEPPPFGLPSPTTHHNTARPVLHDVLALLDQAGHALARADRLLTADTTAIPAHSTPPGDHHPERNAS